MPPKASSFLKDRLGAAALVFAIVLFAVAAATAIALTTGEAYSVRNRAQDALDAAVLAGAAAERLQ